MKYVAVIMDMDDVDIHRVLGPYDDAAQAEHDAQVTVDNLNNVILSGHARVHEWDYFIQPLEAYKVGLDPTI